MINKICLLSLILLLGGCSKNDNQGSSSFYRVWTNCIDGHVFVQTTRGVAQMFTNGPNGLEVVKCKERRK